jgi:hypothetical protein
LSEGLKNRRAACGGAAGLYRTLAEKQSERMGLQPHHSLYIPADRAIRLLPKQGKELHIVGLGMTAAEAGSELERIKGMFLFLPETPAIYPA